MELGRWNWGDGTGGEGIREMKLEEVELEGMEFRRWNWWDGIGRGGTGWNW